VDDLSLVKLRVNELIDAKVQRRAALAAEIESIDAELASARTLLGKWPLEAEKKPARAPRKKKSDISMSRDKVIEYLRAMGPQDKRRIVEHFFGAEADGRNGAILGVWVQSGQLERHADGRYAAPALKLATAG
jgi:F0F1-type ATP synthase membrane subunit b/b'